MLLSRLTLRDVGAYGGTHEFDLETTPERPVVLWVGENGAGKTTLFESILLCLYGQRYSETPVTKKQYHEKIRHLLHQDETGRRSDEASVTLEILYARGQMTGRYRITRTWESNAGRIAESLAVDRMVAGAEEYSSAGSDDPHLQTVIDLMIPRSVARMFFFDGEKIQEMADRTMDPGWLKSLFDDLLGLDIPQQLCRDMGLYGARNSNDTSDAMLAELESANREKEKIQQDLESIREKRIFLGTEISQKRKDLETMEQRFFKLGGTFARDRQGWADKERELKQRVMEHDAALRDVICGDLPLAIVPEHLRQVDAGLQADVDMIRDGFEADTLAETSRYISDSLAPFLLERHGEKVRDEVIGKISGIVAEKSASSRGKNRRQAMFGFSLQETDEISKAIQDVLDRSYDDMRQAESDHMDAIKELEIISAKLATAPQQDEVGPMYTKIKQTAIEIGEMEQEHLTLEQLESQKKSLAVILNSRIRRHLSESKGVQRQQRGIGMIPQIQAALEDYSRKLRIRKIGVLESNILAGVRICLHKERLVTRVSIDPETCVITLYGRNDTEVSQMTMSKGELQMYATAIIWGLVKTSDRPFPFVIDTPLARLDAKHRENMTTRFYPEASHQILMFATDSEVTDHYLGLLAPHLSRHIGMRQDAGADHIFAEESGAEKMEVTADAAV